MYPCVSTEVRGEKLVFNLEQKSAHVVLAGTFLPDASAPTKNEKNMRMKTVPDLQVSNRQH